MKVLHIVVDSVADPKHLYLGSTKDVRSRTDYLKIRNIPFDEILAEDRSDRLLLRKLRSMDLTQYSAAIIEHLIYPASMRFLRQHYPQMQLLVRSIQSEFYQQLHYALAHAMNSHGWQAVKGYLRSLWYLRNSLRRLWLDYRCAKLSDYILCTTPWEIENYWRYVTDPSKSVYLPYFLPDFYVESIPPETEKKFQCLCMTSTTHGTLPFSRDSVRKFSKLVEGLQSRYPEWKFYITGDFPADIFNLPKRVILTGLLDSPLEILMESRAIALLSDFGFGFKTKLVEAIQCRCYLLVSGKLYRRLPQEIQPYCIKVDIESVESFKNALDRCLKPFPGGNLNGLLRSEVFSVLDRLLCGKEIEIVTD